MNGVIDVDYADYNEVLGKGASKTVYKAFDDMKGLMVNGYCNNLSYEQKIVADFHPIEIEANETDSFANHEYDHSQSVIAIHGRREEDGIFLGLRIAEKEGRVRNIYFPFDIEADTALSVATEMVDELEINDQELTKITNMIGSEIANLVLGWRGTPSSVEIPGYACSNYCHGSALYGPLLSYLTSNEPGARTVQVLECSQQECGAVHGRFEEITYQIEGSEQCADVSAPPLSSQSDSLRYADIWGQHKGPDLDPEVSIGNASGDEHVWHSKSCSNEKMTNLDSINNFKAKKRRDSSVIDRSASFPLSEDYENEIRWELRWLKSKYQMQLGELSGKQLGVVSKPLTLKSSGQKHEKEHYLSMSIVLVKEQDLSSKLPLDAKKECANQMTSKPELAHGFCGPEHIVTAKSFFSGTLLPHLLHRAASLPVDAVDV